MQIKSKSQDTISYPLGYDYYKTPENLVGENMRNCK